MKEIEIGEYVRTKNGIIGRSKEVSSVGCWIENDFRISKRDIIKHSKQLIDLIEAGDIVNKELVIDIINATNDKEEIVGRKLITQYRLAQFTGLDIKYYIYSSDIKTILTKEQYIANCYKVGGEDE